MDDTFLFLFTIVLLNIAFLAMLYRVSAWYKLKAEDYCFYLIDLNLVAMLIFLNEYFQVATNYPFAVKLCVIFAVVFVAMEFIKKPIVNNIRGMWNKFRR